MNLSTFLGSNETTVTQSTAAQLIALLLTSKAVADVLAFLGIPATPENYATLAVLFNTALAALYTRFAKPAKTTAPVVTPTNTGSVSP